MKGLSSCHIPSDTYRDNYDSIFGGKDKTGKSYPSAILGRVAGVEFIGAVALGESCQQDKPKVLRDVGVGSN